MSGRHAEKKAQYEACLAQGESASLRAEQEVRVLKEETRVEESRYHYLNAALHSLQVQQFRLQEEMRGYLTIGAATGDSANNGVHTSTNAATIIKRRSYRLVKQKQIISSMIDSSARISFVFSGWKSRFKKILQALQRARTTQKRIFHDKTRHPIPFAQI